MTTTAELPGYPMPRAAGCPLDPPPALRGLQVEAPPTRVRIWDGFVYGVYEPPVTW